MPRFVQRDTTSRSSPEAPNAKRYDATSARQNLSLKGNGYLACSLANTSVSPGDDDDLPGQIRDVLLRCELRFRNEEVGTEGRRVDELSQDRESGGVLTHLDSSGVSD